MIKVLEETTLGSVSGHVSIEGKTIVIVNKSIIEIALTEAVKAQLMQLCVGECWCALVCICS